jgi:hypothetical protein
VTIDAEQATRIQAAFGTMADSIGRAVLGEERARTSYESVALATRTYDVARRGNQLC